MEKKNIVSSVVLIFTVVLSLFFWFIWQNSIEVSINVLIYVSGILILIPFLFVLNILFLLSSGTFIIAASVLSMLPVLYIGQSYIFFALSAFISGVCGLLLTYRSFQKNKDLYKKFSVRHLSQSKNIFLVLIISLSLMTTGKASLSKGDFTIKIPDQIFNFTSKIGSNLIGNAINSKNGPPTALDNQPFGVEIPMITSELAKLGITDEKVGSLIGQNKVLANLTIENQMKVSKDSIEQQLNNVLSPYKTYMSYLIGIVFFLQFIFLSVFFTFISDFLLLLFFKIFQLMGLVSVKTRPENVEFVEI